jgi:hypothetical protein
MAKKSSLFEVKKISISKPRLPKFKSFSPIKVRLPQMKKLKTPRLPRIKMPSLPSVSRIRKR